MKGVNRRYSTLKRNRKITKQRGVGVSYDNRGENAVETAEWAIKKAASRGKLP